MFILFQSSFLLILSLSSDPNDITQGSDYFGAKMAAASLHILVLPLPQTGPGNFNRDKRKQREYNNIIRAILDLTDVSV